MAHAKKKSASGTVAVGGRDICNKLPCDRDDSLLLRYIKNLPPARESNPPLLKYNFTSTTTPLSRCLLLVLTLCCNKIFYPAGLAGGIELLSSPSPNSGPLRSKSNWDWGDTIITCNQITR